MGSLRDGDTPEDFVITYNRCNNALEYVEALTKVIPPHQWRAASIKMLNREFLMDEESWAVVERKRRRALGQSPDIDRMPSFSTRITAGHLMAAYANAHDINHTTDEDPFDAATEIDRSHRDTDPPEGGWTMAETAQRVYQIDGFTCQAEGLHHDTCPGTMTDDNFMNFSVHHRFTRERAKQLRLTPEQYATHIDVPSNCILVWNRYPSGASGCHGRIHSEITNARNLGLLAPAHATV